MSINSQVSTGIINTILMKSEFSVDKMKDEMTQQRFTKPIEE